MEHNRVKFFSAKNMSNVYYLEKAQNVIECFDEKIEYTNINDIIEFHNTKCLFEHGIYLNYWSDEKQARYVETIKKFSKQVGKYFSNITGENLLSIFESVEREYTEDFWYLINQYKTYRNFTSETFKTVFLASNFILDYVLRQPKITQHFGAELREYILSDCIYAELVLDKYEVKHDNDEKTIYFPPDLTGEDMENLILQYIQSVQPNPNYLELIKYTQSTKELPISDITRLKAQKRYEKEREILFEQKKGYETSLLVSFSETLTKEKEITVSPSKQTLTYSLVWIKDNLDFPTLLNNFIYLFEFTDIRCRSLHVHHESLLGVLERFIGVKGRKYYFKGAAFDHLQYISILQMMAYRQTLLNNNIRLEEVFEWFFTKYLDEEFYIRDFRISIPNEKSIDLEKCRMLATEIEGILKQFQLLVQYGNIDHELLQISSNHLFYRDIPSFINKKYLYGKGNDYKFASYYFFSDQCMLIYIQRLNKEYHSFFDLICHEKVMPSDYPQYKKDLDWLIENGFLQINNDNNLEMIKERVYFLKDLYQNDVSCTSYMNKQTVDWFENKNMIEFESTLFSRPEQDYLNYLMNHSEFSNGLDLRNRYLHATQPIDEEINKRNYNVFLNVLVLVIIKINEEFCLKQDLNI